LFLRKAIKKYTKELPRHFIKREIIEKLKIEINQLKNYNNKYMAKYLDYLIEDNYLYLIFEYCEVDILFLLK
jgi:hypothetical protein